MNRRGFLKTCCGTVAGALTLGVAAKAEHSPHKGKDLLARQWRLKKSQEWHGTWTAYSYTNVQTGGAFLTGILLQPGQSLWGSNNQNMNDAVLLAVAKASERWAWVTPKYHYVQLRGMRCPSHELCTYDNVVV